MPGAVDERGDAIAAVSLAPDQVRVLARFEFLAAPVGVEALDDFVNLMSVGCDHRVVPGLRQILGLPVERLHEGLVVIDDHRLLVGHVVRGIAVEHVDATGEQRLSGLFIVFFATAAGGIQHDPDIYAARTSGEHCLEQLRIREHKHLYPKRFRGSFDGIHNRLCRVIGQHDQRARHMASRSIELYR